MPAELSAGITFPMKPYRLGTARRTADNKGMNMNLSFGSAVIRRFVLATLLSLSSLGVQAFCIHPEAHPEQVIEFYNLGTSNYFLTADRDEIEGLLNGGAGGGWVRTGFTMSVPSRFNYCSQLGRPVHRFYSPSLNAHRYAMDLQEVASLRAPGSTWIYEKHAFNASTRYPGESWGKEVVLFTAPSQGDRPGRQRLVAHPKARAAAEAAGWTSGQTLFVASDAGEYLNRADFFPYTNWEYQCNDSLGGACIHASNIPPPASWHVSLADMGGVNPAYAALTGLGTSWVQWSGDAPTAGRGDKKSFVQPTQMQLRPIGIYLSTDERGPAGITSFSPRRFVAELTSGSFPVPKPVFPYAPADRERELRISLELRLRLLEVSATSHGYGLPVLEFVDGLSGRSILFAVQAFGTVPAADGAGLDANGKVIVATVFRENPRYGSSRASSFLAVSKTYFSSIPSGEARKFEFRLPESGFREVIAEARRYAPELSDVPSDYRLANFELRTEVAGDGRIGYNLPSFSVEVLNTEP